ncbi:MAG: LLM class flavin-dependent oxidoreductase [Firmicutes bacterium]|nr:LLM class flavin-dependent oxidoreductase [Bacillota bacterium]MCL5971823.1 LLM class flavin-dependent oxidoreductase [Bacillota bacterium]
MKIGFFTLTDNPPAYGSSRQDPNLMVKQLAEQGVLAEELGFHSFWVPEHHFALLGVLPSPSLLLAYVAARTKRLRLAPATVLLPVNHPVRMAEEFALLDVLSDGRAIFSAGRGYDKREYDVFETNFEQSRNIFFEQLEIIKGLWTNSTYSHSGSFYHIPETTIVPRPVQHPYPPIYLAAFSGPTIKKAAEMGENVIFAPFAASMVFGSVAKAVETFQTESQAHGFLNKKTKISYFLNVVENKSEEEKTKQRMMKYFHGILPAFPSDPTTAPPHIRYFVDIVEKLKAMQTTDLSDQTIIVGDPETCVTALKKAEAAGVDEVILYLNFGGLSHRETVTSMENVAKYILPHFNEE